MLNGGKKQEKVNGKLENLYIICCYAFNVYIQLRRYPQNVDGI